MKRAGASSSQTPAAPTHFASAFLPTTSFSPSSSSSARPTGPHRQSSALDFPAAAEYVDDDDDDSPHPNHVDRLDSLPLFNTRAMNTAAAQAAAVADSSSSSSPHLGGIDGAAPRRRGVAGGLAAKDGRNGGFDPASLDLDGGLDGDEKRGLTGNGGTPARREKPAYKPPAKTWREWAVNNADHLIPAAYTIVSMMTRYYKIGWSNSVVWDEAHFGKFGSHYIKGEFYFDVHPPLGKMLVGLAGLLAGYDGNFEFKSGTVYPPEMRYGLWRLYMATYGVLMVPVAWYTCKGLKWNHLSCHLVTLMVLFDVGWLTISRFILLDSMLLLFTFTTALGLVNFHNMQDDPFSDDWWLWLVFTGLSIGCVISVKWVGFFATALVGLYTIEDLWHKFGDLSMPFRTYVKHWAARILGFIILPLSVYLFSFKLHFLILRNSGTGDSQMSSLFQANLNGNDFAQNPLEAAFHSKVTLKNMGYGGGLLHSHVQTMPVGSFQQQVTCYHYKDDNNHWTILPVWEADPIDPNGEPRFLQDGDIIRLLHTSTQRNLHSHAIIAPVSKQDYEVAGYGNLTIGDANDYWQVEVVDDAVRGRKQPGQRIHSLTSRLRFRHINLNCYLKAANVILPQWGFKQVEVSCDKENNPSDAHTYWNIESHWNEKLPKGDAKLYKSPFFSDFWHLNIAMMTSNNALVPDPDKEDVLASPPFAWPFLYLGLRMCGWAAENIKYYLIGNPVIWYSSSISLFVGVGVLIGYLMRGQRKYNDFGPGEWEKFIFGFKLAFGGWALHYIPFLIMGRVTYLHHYMPPLWFAVLMLGHLLDHFVFSNGRLTTRAKRLVFGGYALAVIGVFWWFKGVSFGISGFIEEHWGLRWRRSWNIYN